MDIDAEILAYYEQGEERGRLTSAPSLELVRTKVLLERFLPPAPAAILDVGGGSDVYASWLAGRGYRVHLVDPVPVHVEQSRAAGGFTASVGDARDLDEGDDSFDAVLLLGPLYHLTDRAERVQALAEARRVCRSGGAVVAAAISHQASTYDGFFRQLVDRPGFASIMLEDLRTGLHQNPDRTPGQFTTAYFHTVQELAGEIEVAGLSPGPVLPVEGMLTWVPDIEARLADEAQCTLILDVLAIMESDPAALAATAHLLAVATA